MRKLIILVDLDSTVADLHAEWHPRYNKKFNDDLTIERIKSWDTHLYCKAGKAVYSILSEPGIYRNLPTIPGAMDACRKLVEDGHRLVVSTAAPKGSCDDKVAWVKDNMPFVDSKDVFLGGSKNLLKADVLIDDGPHNINEYRAAWGHYPLLCTIKYPYNEACWKTADLVAEDWHNFEQCWKQIYDEVAYFADQDLVRGH